MRRFGKFCWWAAAVLLGAACGVELASDKKGSDDAVFVGAAGVVAFVLGGMAQLFDMVFQLKNPIERREP